MWQEKEQKTWGHLSITMTHSNLKQTEYELMLLLVTGKDPCRHKFHLISSQIFTGINNRSVKIKNIKTKILCLCFLSCGRFIVGGQEEQAFWSINWMSFCDLLYQFASHAKHMSVTHGQNSDLCMFIEISKIENSVFKMLKGNAWARNLVLSLNSYIYLLSFFWLWILQMSLYLTWLIWSTILVHSLGIKLISPN